MSSSSVANRTGLFQQVLMPVMCGFFLLMLGMTVMPQASRPTVIVDDGPQINEWITFVESPSVGRIAPTNVLALHGQSLPRVDFFVGRENPTIAATYPLELGYWGDDGRAIFNPFYDPFGYTLMTIDIDYSTIYWSDADGLPAFQVTNGPEPKGFAESEGFADCLCSPKHPKMWGKDHWSTDLLQALLDNGALTRKTCPETLAIPEETAANWPYQTTVNNYSEFANLLPELKMMPVFSTEDHVQVAVDKPHIHQAYDGFHNGAGFWVRLNPDRAHVEAFGGVGRGAAIPDNDTIASLRRG